METHISPSTFVYSEQPASTGTIVEIGGPSLIHEPPSNQAYIRSYWAEKKREQRSKERNPSTKARLSRTRSRKNICSAMARCWHRQTEGLTINEQQEILEQLKHHRTFSKLRNADVESSLVCGVRNTLTELKVPHSASELFVKRTSLMMILNNGDRTKSINQSRIATVLGVHRRNIAAASTRLDMKGEDEVLPLSACQRQLPQNSRITSETRDLVYAFWTSETRVSPNKKDICKQRIEAKCVIKHPIHLLDESQVELYKRFRSTYPTVMLSCRSFETLKPFFVRKLKERYTCCCVYHVQMIYFKEAFNQMRQNKFGHHGKGHLSCACSICCTSSGSGQCSANQAVCQHISILWESILCPKPIDSEYHAKKCLLGNCLVCGVSKLSFCPDEIATNSREVTVKVFKDVGTGQVDKKGREKKRKDLVVERMQSASFIRLFSDHLKSFIKHNFLFRWQAQQFKDCLLKFPSDVVVSVVDFAENYSCKMQNEIQSMHWWSNQVTILVHISYVRNSVGVVEKTLHFYISDDMLHDTLFVQHCFMLHDKWLKEQGHHLRYHWVWSDGAASQFKARRPFYFVARYYQLTGLHMMHNFSASGHGKGEHDGAGAVIKRTLTHEELKPDGWPIRCAVDVVNFLNAKFQPTREVHRCSTRRFFWFISKDDVQRNLLWDCEAITGSRSLHCVDGYSTNNPCAVRFRTLSCFCDPCVNGQWRRCKNRQHIEEWKYVSIVPLAETIEANSDCDEEDVEDNNDMFAMPMSQDHNMAIYEGYPEVLCSMLSIGDTFAVKAAESNEDFYLLKCTKRMYQTARAQKDLWHNKIVRGGKLVEGLYYGQVESKVDTYTLLDQTPPVMIYSHLVRAIRFPMEAIPGIHNQFMLSTEVYENIYNSMPYDDGSDQDAGITTLSPSAILTSGQICTSPK